MAIRYLGIFIFLIFSILSSSFSFFDMNQIIQRSISYNESPDYQQLLENLRAKEDEYINTLFSYDVIAKGSYNFSKEYSNTAEADSSTLALSATKILLLPLGTIMNLSSELSKPNFFKDGMGQSDSIRLNMTYTIPVSMAQYITNTKSLKDAASKFLLAKIEYRDALGQLVINNIRRFLDLVQNINDYRVYRKNYEESENMLQITRLKVNLGAYTPLDLYTMEQQVMTEKQSVDEKKQNINELIRIINLNLGIGISFNENIELPSINFNEFKIDSFNYYFNKFWDKSFYMLNFQIQSTNIEESYIVNRAEYEPILTVGGQAEKSKTGDEAPQDSWSMAGSLKWDFSIYDKARDKSRIDVHKQYTINKSQLQKRLEEKKVVLINAYEQINTTISKNMTAELQLNIARQSFGVAVLKYKLGQISALEYSRYADNYTQSQLSFNTRKTEVFLGLLNFYKEVGILEEYLRDNEYSQIFKK